MAELLYLIIKSVYFILPAYLANMAPVIVQKINFLKYPLDFNLSFKGKRIFGNHKTFRGLFFGIVGAILVSYIQYLLTTQVYFSNISLLNYESWLLIGLLMGVGAIVGDSVESFFKRRLKIRPGKPLKIFDQIDFIVGAIIFISLIVVIPWGVILIILLISPLLTIVINYISYYLKVRGEKW